MRFSCVVVLLAIVAPCLAASSVPAGLTLEITATRVERRTFDPKSPPPDMPPLRPPEIGQCVYRFSCDMETRVSREAGAKPPSRALVQGVKITTRLEIVLWTPNDGRPAVIEHEEAHREICDYYYGNAHAIASDLGHRMIGQSIVLASPESAAVQQSVKRFQQTFIAEYMERTMGRCSIAQTHFDQITDHSRKRLDVRAAITQAIAAETRSRSNADSRPVRAAPRRPAPNR